MGIKITSHGSFTHTESILKKIQHRKWAENLKKFAEEGVAALSAATPKDTGKTADSWRYDIRITGNATSITWSNDNRTDDKNGIPIVVLIYYCHAMPNGGYVQPNDFITPTMEPIFKKIADDAWKELTKG